MDLDVRPCRAEASDKTMIVHYSLAEKFTEPFIDFVERHFDRDEHFFIIAETGAFHTTPRPNVICLPKSITERRKLAVLIQYFNNADKVILHGLFDRTLLICYALQPWLLERSYWVIWGGDLYVYRHQRLGIRSRLGGKLRSYVIKRFGHLVTFVRGDYELARRWYGATGIYHECYLYPSNIFNNTIGSGEQKGAINVLLGNSADPTNKHLEVLEKLQRFVDFPIRIYCPLSYGDRDYADEVARAGSQAFGERFVALRQFMPFEEYLALLGEIDIAVFAHERQQAMGNTITLLGLGKKVFMRKDVSQWALFSEMGIMVFDVDLLDVSPMETSAAENNRAIVTQQFSESNLKKQWQDIFGSRTAPMRRSDSAQPAAGEGGR
jgi:dTDP-N-acetylfucosamine:lipid II N-acetylfucosaminyltransferase